jgi:hypothetical protein
MLPPFGPMEWFFQISRGKSLNEIPLSHGSFLCQNGARERSIIQLIDFLYHWLSLTLSPTAPCAPPCPTALGLIGPRKKEKKTGFDDVS